MLDKKFQFEGGDKNYILDLKRDSNWSSSKRRLLIIQQTVPGYDLKAKELSSNDWLPNCVKYARSIARAVAGDVKEFSFATINFNNRKHLHLKGPAKAEADSEFAARTRRLIKKLDPTHILFCGDLSLLYPVQVAVFKNGWVHRIDDRLVTSTLDFARLVEKDGALANCLGFWCRHLANLMIGKNPYQVSLQTKPILVDTIAKFDKVMRKFDEAKEIAVDTETKNLSVLKNRIYTIQFAFEDNPDRGYVIPIDHPHEDNPFSEDDRKYIKRQLKVRFAKRWEPGKILLTFNGAFDLRVVRRSLNLPIIYLPVWEIMAGEHDLDENCSALRDAGVRIGDLGPQGLAAVLCSYGDDFYMREDTTFSKKDRASTGSISPTDKGFLLYGATDVVSLHHIKKSQLLRASHQELGGKNYRPFFINHMVNQMSDTVHQLSHLKDSGSMIDRKYLRSLLKPDSVLAKAITSLLEEFKAFPEVRAANAELKSDSGLKAGSLFGSAKAGKSQWVFSFNKTKHKIKLFFDILGLEPVSKTATGEPAVDKEFIATYKDRNFLVQKYGEYQEAAKLLSTYAKGWYKRLTREIDGALDSHLRADFLFHNVDTGRLASRDPNFQNIATRGKLAKIIKEMFVTEDGRLLIRFDYSAHEVRGWSIMSGDTVLASAFKAGQALRQRFIKAHPPHAKLKFPLNDEQVKEYTAKAKTSREARNIMLTHEIAKELKTKGDIHIQNVFRFFRKWVEKSDPLRDAIKAVVFGVLYGKAAKTLGHDTKKAEVDAIRAKMNEVNKEMMKAPSSKLDKRMQELETEYQNLLDDDRTAYAQEIIDKMFTEFKRGKQWVDRMVELAQTKFYVYSPLGRMRRLFAAMLRDKRIMSQQVRRGMNAPGQGFASEIAVKASRLVMENYYDDQPRLKKYLEADGDYRLKFNRIVHDASYFSVPFEMVIPFLHILQYESTYGIADLYEKQFGLKFTVEPEIEMEIGVRDTSSHKWDWALPSLLQIIDKSVTQGCDTGIYTANKEEIMATILAPWRDEKCRAYLNKRYPLLKVDLDKEIGAAVEAYDEHAVAARKAAKAAIKKAKGEKEKEA